MASYTYLVADLRTGVIRDEIPFSGVGYGEVLNAPGSFNATIPSAHPKCTNGNLAPGKTALYVLREVGSSVACVWGGIIWTARKAENSASDIQIGAEGFWSYPRRRKIRATQTFEQVDQAAIARALITYMNAVSPAGNIGIVNGAQVTGVLRDRTYNGYDRQYVGELIEQLGAVENGFDFSVDVSFDGVSTFTKTFNIWYPHKGTRTGLTWEVGVHCDFNGWNIDATQMANQIDAFGAGDGEAMLIATAVDPGTDYPLLEADVSYKTITEDGTLEAHAKDALSSRRLPSVMPALSLRPTRDTEFGAYQVGDEVRINGNDGFAAIDGPFRIMSREVQVSDEGDESTKVAFQDAQVAY